MDFVDDFIHATLEELEPGRVVRVRGAARGLDGPLLGPLSGRRLATFTLRVSQWVSDSTGFKKGKSLELLEDVDRGQAFLLQLDDVTVRVDRRGWSLLRGLTTTPRSDRDAILSRYFERHGEADRNLFWGFGPSYRYEEIGLPEGAEVEVEGLVEVDEEPNPLANYRDAPVRFVLVPPHRGKLRIRVL